MSDDFTILSAVGRDVGQKRKHNEDFVAFFEPGDPVELNQSGRLYVVADGVGGALKGEKASQYAAEKVIFDYYNDPEPDLGRRLTKAFRRAGNEIYDHMKRKATGGRMATTMVAAAIRGSELTVANVGDSRAYLIRNGKANQITRDHTIAGELIRDGEITEEEARHLKGKNRITRSLGGEFNVHVDIFPDIQLIPGDRIILCSDGVTRYTLQPDIAGLSSAGNPEQIVQRFIDYANECGGADNISVAAIEVASPELHAAATIRRGTVPAPVDWDEFETQPVAEIPRSTTFARKLRSMFTPRQWSILAAMGILSIALVTFLLMSIFTSPDTTSEVESTEVVETEEGAITTLETPTASEISFELTLESPETVEEEIPTRVPPDGEIVEDSGESSEFRPELVIQNSSVENRYYFDDFSKPNLWIPPVGDKAIASVTQGHLEFIDKTAEGKINWSLTPYLQLENIYVELDVDIGECVGRDSFAIVIRLNHVGSQGYAVEFSCDGYYRLRRFDRLTSAEIILDWEYSGSINIGPHSQNRVGIIAKDDQLYVVANGEIIGYVVDDTYSSGGLSLYVNAIETPGLTAYFDNLDLWRIDSEN